MAFAHFALSLLAALCCAASVASGLPTAQHSRQETKAAQSGWDVALFPTLFASVDSDTRPISSRQRRQTGGPVGGGGNAERRSQRVTSAPLLQSLSLLDLPVFSRGDRPSSMDKTLGAIFSKVAFSATNQSAPNKNSDADKVDENEPNNSTTTTETPTTTTPATTTTTTTTGSSTSAPVRSKPVFEFDTRVFDFIPYDRTPLPTSDSNRQYNPNVPGLRGPSRINTARNPTGNNQPFNLRPTIPPLVDLAGQTANRFATKQTTTPSTTTTVATVVDSVEEEQEEEEEEEEDTLDTTTAATTTTTTTTTTAKTTVTTATSPESSTATSPSTRDVSGRVTGDDAGSSRDAAWSIQVYGTSSLFALLGVFALSNLLRLRTSTRRLLSTSHCLSIQLLVLFLAITRSIHLLYDAYNQRRLLPPALAFSIFNVAFPCLSSALAVLLLGIFKATKLQVMPSALVKPALWAALVAFHFALSLSIDIVVGSVGGLFSLHLASQAYFVLWSLALSLGYLAAFAPATRAAVSLQTETVRSHLTALHVHGASLPRYLPQPTLLRAVRVTLAAAVLALLVAAFQLYGMFGVYGLPWRQQPTSVGSSIANANGAVPVVLTAEFLARYQGLQRERNLNVDALREVLGLPSSLSSVEQADKQLDHWPVATENFWPWWTYQLIARLLELIMAALVAYVAVQPLRYNQATLAEKQGADVSANSAAKKSSLWMFAGRSLKNGSIETLSTLCCQTNRGAMGRNGGAGETVIGGAMTDLSPVKSVASDESPYPAANLRNYCYSNPTSHQHLHLHQVQDRSSSSLYDSKRAPPQHQRPRCAINMSHQQVSSVLVNDSGFIRFRDGIAGDSTEHMEQTYEEVDRQRGGAVAVDPHHSHQHIYQELGYKAPSLTYYSTASSVTSSSNTNKGTATTPSVCTYEHLCRRGLAGYYEPQLYEMQLPNNAQLLSLLAKESCQVFQPCNIYGGSLAGQHAPPMAGQHLLRHQHCQHCNCSSNSSSQHMASAVEIESTVSFSCGQKSSNYESYGPKPEGQSPANQSDVLQDGIRMEDVYGMRLADPSRQQEERTTTVNLAPLFCAPHLRTVSTDDHINGKSRGETSNRSTTSRHLYRTNSSYSCQRKSTAQRVSHSLGSLPETFWVHLGGASASGTNLELHKTPLHCSYSPLVMSEVEGEDPENASSPGSNCSVSIHRSNAAPQGTRTKDLHSPRYQNSGRQATSSSCSFLPKFIEQERENNFQQSEVPVVLLKQNFGKELVGLYEATDSNGNGEVAFSSLKLMDKRTTLLDNFNFTSQVESTL